MSLQYTSKEAIERKHAAIVNGFHQGITHDLEFRRQQLRNIYYAILDNEEALKQALVVDLHRSPSETEILELNGVLAEAATAIAKLDEWAADSSLPTLTQDQRYAAGKAVLRKTPYGATLIIGPWNYPYLCTVAPLISAIAAGNTVVLKPTEVAVESTRVLVGILEAALDSRVFQVVVGSIDETTQLLALKWDKIMLTGSNRVGKVVAHAAAEQLAPVTLELGGKSPTIITRKANVALAAKRIAWGKFVNAGQTCIAPDYVIIDRDVSDEFVKHLQAALRKTYPDLAAGGDSRDFAHIVTDRLFERAAGLVAKSKARNVWQWGKPDAATRFYPPTLLQGVTLEDTTMDEEIFAPLLPIVEVDDAAREAPHIVSGYGHDHPLALYIFSGSNSEIESLLRQTRSGAVMVNDSVQQGGSSIIPFGGVGPSGTGRYHGKYGFDEFTYERPVVVQPTWIESLLKSRYAPYTSRNTALLRAVSRPRVSFGRTGRVGRSGWAKLWRLVVKRVGILVALLFAYYFFK